MFAHKSSQFRKSPACQREFLGFDKRSSDRYFYTRSLQVVKCRSKLNALLKKVSQLGQRKDWKTALMFTTQHIWLLYLNSSTVLSYFCRLRLASSQIMFPSTKSMSYSRILSVSRLSAVGIEAVGLSAVHVDSLELIGTVSILFNYQRIENFRCLFFQSLISVPIENKSTQKKQVVVIWLTSIFFKRETVDCTTSQ